MRRALCILLLILLSAACLPSSAAGEQYPAELRSSVGRSYVFAPSRRGTWRSSDEAVAQVNGRGIINFLSEGEATVFFTAKSGKRAASGPCGAGGEMPAIRQGIDSPSARRQAVGQPFPRSNKYTFWLRTRRAVSIAAHSSTTAWNRASPQSGNGSEPQVDGRAHAVHGRRCPSYGNP